MVAGKSESSVFSPMSQHTPDGWIESEANGAPPDSSGCCPECFANWDVVGCDCAVPEEAE